MPYVKRDASSVVTALYARPQPGLAEEFLTDDHPDVIAYLNPPPPTDAERIDAVFPQTDVGRVIFEAFFELANDVRVLKGQSPITKAQLRDWFAAKLGG